MLKGSIALLLIILISMLVVVFTPNAHALLGLLVSAQNWVAEILKNVFTGGPVGDLIRQVLALLALPVGIALLPVIFYLLIRRGWFPYFTTVLWAVWLIQTAALVIQYKA